MPHATTAPGQLTLAGLLAPEAHHRTILRPHHVGGTVAWQILVRDGVLRAVRGDAALPAHAVSDPVLRAGLLAADIPAGAVATARTAAWVHAGTGDATALELTYQAGRHPPDRPRGARLWQGPLLHGDTVHLDGVPVTTPDRTVVELVLHDDEPVVPVLALVQHAGADLRRARRALEMRTRAVGRPRARRWFSVIESGIAAAADHVGPA